jgi:hypothetical protein
MNLVSLVRPSTPFAALAAGAVLLSFTVVPLSAEQNAAGAPNFAAIDRFVESERQAMRVPGVAIGIVRGDRVAHLA